MNHWFEELSISAFSSLIPVMVRSTSTEKKLIGSTILGEGPGSKMTDTDGGARQRTSAPKETQTLHQKSPFRGLRLQFFDFPFHHIPTFGDNSRMLSSY